MRPTAHNKFIKTFAASLCLFTIAYGGALWAAELVVETEHQVLFVTDGSFSDVRENVELAITGQGIVVNNVAHVGLMLERTGADLGAISQLYVHAEVLEFCSAQLSREMMTADRYHLAYCPYGIHVFELPEQPGRIYVGYRRLPVIGDGASRLALQKIDTLLREMVDEALSW
jgi:uncharacterized protein (DUF302 family)